MKLLPAELEALFARRCEFGILNLISSRPCRGGKKLVMASRNFQVCDGHFRWAGPEHVTDLSDCLPSAKGSSDTTQRAATGRRKRKSRTRSR